MDTDRKIAIGIAAALLVGFAGIATLSMMSGAATPDREGPAVPVSRARTDSEPVRLASRTAPAAPEAPPAPYPGREAVSAGTPEEAAGFQVEPGVNYLARGIEAYQERNLEHAVAYLMAAADETPDRPYPHYLLGLSLWKSGRLDEAAASMRRSAELGTAVKTFINLSRIENDRGRFDEALQAARKARELDPEDAGALFLEGRSLHNLGEMEAAVEALEHSLEIDPDNGYVWNLLGLTFLLDGTDGAAVDAMERAAELVPDVAYVQNNLGMALELGGRAGEAIAAYRRAVELDSDHARAASNLARLDAGVPGPAADAVVAEAAEPAPADVPGEPEDGI